jgi:hypothetical protein
MIEPPALDLLGDEVIITYHGSSRNRLGGIHSYLARATSIEQLIRIRQRHGYVVADANPQARSLAVAVAATPTTTAVPMTSSR